jgi:hypothetical protein
MLYSGFVPAHDTEYDDSDCTNSVGNKDLSTNLFALAIIITRSFLESIEIFACFYITDGP